MNFGTIGEGAVVYHYNPTSNRNDSIRYISKRMVVYHYNPTSNRNRRSQSEPRIRLYIIIILHQTATV